MSDYIDPIEQVITDSVNDAQISEEPTTEVASDDTPDTPVEAVEAPTSDSDAEPVAEEPSLEVASPAAGNAAAKPKPEDTSQPKDDFERLAGVSQLGVGGRENRIPYSRVKKITEKAVSEVVEAVTGRKLKAGEKALDAVKEHVARIPQLETENKDYLSRLETVSRFEHVMENEPEKFLQMLSKLPAYNEFFQFVQQAVTGQYSPQEASATQQAVPAIDGMPEPNEELPDGTKVYNMEGLQALLAWNAKQVEAKVTKQIEDRYKPIESEWQERRRIEATIPIVRAKIAEAKTWPLFDENEEEITRVLEQNPRMDLDQAYRVVVFPKLQADRTKIRQDVIQDIKRAPVATSVAARPVKPNPTPDGPRSLEDIIKESIDTNLKR